MLSKKRKARLIAISLLHPGGWLLALCSASTFSLSAMIERPVPCATIRDIWSTPYTPTAAMPIAPSAAQGTMDQLQPEISGMRKVSDISAWEGSQWSSHHVFHAVETESGGYEGKAFNVWRTGSHLLSPSSLQLMLQMEEECPLQLAYSAALQTVLQSAQ